jgi:hypothetical protein
MTFYILLPIENHCALFVVAEADGALDKARKHKKRQLEDTLNRVIKKQKVTTHTYLFCWATFYSSTLLFRFLCSYVQLFFFLNVKKIKQ